MVNNIFVTKDIKKEDKYFLFKEKLAVEKFKII